MQLRSTVAPASATANGPLFTQPGARAREVFTQKRDFVATGLADATARLWLHCEGIAQALVCIHQVGDRQPLPANLRARHLHILIEGWAFRSQILADGARQIIDTILPGDLCPSARHERARMSEIEACGPTRVAVVDEERLSEHARIAVEQRRCRGQRDVELRLHARVVSLGRRDARGRLAYLIAETHARLDKVGLSKRGVFQFPFTQEHLADMLGLTPVHVNRTLARLRDDGILLIAHRQATILDMEKLYWVGGLENLDSAIEGAGNGPF